jgi:hypothetical protein
VNVQAAEVCCTQRRTLLRGAKRRATFSPSREGDEAPALRHPARPGRGVAAPSRDFARYPERGSASLALAPLEPCVALDVLVQPAAPRNVVQRFGGSGKWGERLFFHFRYSTTSAVKAQTTPNSQHPTPLVASVWVLDPSNRRSSTHPPRPYRVHRRILLHLLSVSSFHAV